MALGLSTYDYFWRGSERMPRPWTLADMLDDTARLGATVFQICDHPAIEDWSGARLRELRAHADGLGIRLELGTRGIRREHLLRYLDLAEALGASLVRTMQNTADDHPGPDEFQHELSTITDELEHRAVTLALETYEQVSTTTLVGEVARLGHPRVGICLDVANVIAALESPVDAMERAAAYVVNLHVKDFRFVRSPGLIGFELTGAPLGTGLLDLEALLDRVRPRQRRISAIVEHWLPWRGDVEATARAEDEWTTRAAEVLSTRV